MCWRSASRAWCATCTPWARTHKVLRRDSARPPRTMELPMRRLTAKHLSSVVTALILAGSVAFAQTPQERQWCESENEVTVDQRIDGCSAVIKAGREKGDKLAEVFNNRGVAYRLKGDHERGIADFAKHDYDHAIDDYNQAIKLKADFARAFDNRCWARAVLGVLKPALADCSQALRLTPRNAATLDSRGFIFLKMSQFDAAVSDYDAALRFNPKRAFPLYGRGLARLKNGDTAGESDMAAAKALQPDIAEEYARYGLQEAR